MSLNSNGGLAMQGIEQQSELESVSSFPATPVSVSVTTSCVYWWEGLKCTNKKMLFAPPHAWLFPLSSLLYNSHCN